MTTDNKHATGQQLTPKQAAEYLRKMQRDLEPRSTYVERCLAAWSKMWGQQYEAAVRKEMAA